MPTETVGNQDIKHTELSLHRKKCTACFLPRRLATVMVNGLVTTVTSVEPATLFILDPFSLDLDCCFSVSRIYLCRRCYMCVTNGAEVVNRLVTSYGQAIQTPSFSRLPS